MVSGKILRFKEKVKSEHQFFCCCQSPGHVQIFVTAWNLQAPQPMEFSRQEYWSGQSFPSPGDLPDLGIKPGSPTLQADSLPSEPLGKPKGKFIFYKKLRNNSYLKGKYYWHFAMTQKYIHPYISKVFKKNCGCKCFFLF